MEVWSCVMGPERVLPNSEDELGEDERPSNGAPLPGGVVWSGGGGGGEEEGGMELDAEEEEEEEEENSGAYYYQPLNQEPDGLNHGGEDPGDEREGPDEQGEEPGDRGEGPDEQGEEPGEQGEVASHMEQLQQVQQRIQVMGLHLPEAPPPDSDEEEEPEGAVERTSIPMDADHVELVKRTMASVALPSLGVPPWAREISDDQWTDLVQRALNTPRRPRLPHVPGP
ncbi:male-enhanced antigen 1 [Mugil cephalus]|uniref:male-enhanced antigen 1 n=1 Tax=Mugil cephalus TaxID=48193 RepID=UPI001FB59577|nr:male-enhanced antigen 1 [Mugil cephalus]XP_047459091.1 male-enhanced antigen 1 [Mugil cephalus]